MAENPLPMLLGYVLPDMAGAAPAKPIQEPQEVTDFSDPNLQSLYQACANGDPVNAKALLAGVDVNNKDYGGRTPLHLACGCKSAGSKELVQLLLDHGADANAVDSVGMTPMDVAVKTQNRGVRKLLEAAGVELRSALEQKARESSWLLNSADFKLRREIGNTLKSVVHLADWNGTTVVVKCIWAA